jgi:uncharacterized protein
MTHNRPRSRRILTGLGLAIAILGLGSPLLAYLVMEGLWSQEVGYSQVFWLPVVTKLLLWIAAMGSTLLYLGGNFYWAYQQSSRFPTASIIPGSDKLVSPGKTYRSLATLLLSLSGVGFTLAIVLTHYGQEIYSVWAATLSSQSHHLRQLVIAPATLAPFSTALDQWETYPLLGLGMLVLMGLLLKATPFALGLISIGLGLGLGFVIASQWSVVLAALHGTPFQESDPIFGLDLGFYIFRLPLWELIQFWGMGISLVGFLGVAWVYLLSGDSIRAGRLPTLSLAARRHLYGVSAIGLGAIALNWWLSRYHLLYSPKGAIYGVGFTEAQVLLPARTALGIGTLVLALVLAYRALWPPQRHKADRGALAMGVGKVRPTARITPRSIKLTLTQWLGGYLAIALLLEIVSPLIVQRFVVEPNELARERPYIAHGIHFTRHAFDLDTIETQTFTPSGTLTPAVLKANDLTLRNIRIWDAKPLLQANRQLQRIRPYYEFPDADIDRYHFDAGPDANPNAARTNGSGDKRQVLIAARELDFKSVPRAAQTWINRHLIYTHGYGFTVSPVNRAAPSGLPEYFIKDIGTATDSSDLQPSSPAVQASIPTETPRIYYGQLTTDFIATNTRLQELDYPQGDDNVYNTYDGLGGIPLKTPWRRGLMSFYLRDINLLLTQNFIPQTRILFRRQIQERVRAIAPFLKLDSDPYLVSVQIANPQKEQSSSETSAHLFWIMDAYTQSDRYPYSAPNRQGFNYLRNSVKVVIDAYHGDVQFYAIDPTEPVLQTWQRIFPSLFQPIAQMPGELQRHLRYPTELFQAQAESLLTYHMTDPQVFYNREDEWRFPQEIYGNEAQQVNPYYLIMSLPDSDQAEFVLLTPFTPAARNNLIAWMAARSDGQNYGKRLLYQFPKRELVFGPEQLEALINQDPIISQQISLWNRQGSRVLQGNLLVIPIERSLLYVEPLYLEAEQTAVPTLVRVVAIYQDRIVMANSLEGAIAQLFAPQSANATPTSNSTTVVRPIDSP